MAFTPTLLELYGTSSALFSVTLGHYTEKKCTFYYYYTKFTFLLKTFSVVWHSWHMTMKNANVAFHCVKLHFVVSNSLNLESCIKTVQVKLFYH